MENFVSKSFFIPKNWCISGSLEQLPTKLKVMVAEAICFFGVSKIISVSFVSKVLLFYDQTSASLILLKISLSILKVFQEKSLL